MKAWKRGEFEKGEDKKDGESHVADTSQKGAVDETLRACLFMENFSSIDAYWGSQWIKPPNLAVEEEYIEEMLQPTIRETNRLQGLLSKK